MAQRLKVFVTSDGLTDYVVAVSSKAKAMAAWGVRQDVFKEGAARETDDAELVRAALASPGDVLRRPAGGGGPLAALKALTPAKARKPKGPSPAQLRKVAALQAKLDALEAAQATAMGELAAERAALERRAAKLEDRYAAQLKAAQAALSAAKQAPE